MPEPKVTKNNDKDIEENKIIAAISYLWLLSIVILLVKRDSDFVQFHAKQGLILFIISVILWFIPFIGWILNILVFICIIMGFIKAISGEKWEIPVIANLAKKINL